MKGGPLHAIIRQPHQSQNIEHEREGNPEEIEFQFKWER
jgi:hypothetical protein